MDESSLLRGIKFVVRVCNATQRYNIFRSRILGPGVVHDPNLQIIELDLNARATVEIDPCVHEALPSDSEIIQSLVSFVKENGLYTDPPFQEEVRMALVMSLDKAEARNKELVNELIKKDIEIARLKKLLPPDKGE